MQLPALRPGEYKEFRLSEPRSAKEGDLVVLGTSEVTHKQSTTKSWRLEQNADVGALLIGITSKQDENPFSPPPDSQILCRACYLRSLTGKEFWEM